MIWSGVGIVMTALVGYVMFGNRFNTPAINYWYEFNCVGRGYHEYFFQTQQDIAKNVCCKIVAKPL